MEVKTRTLVVLTPDGRFERIPRRGRSCGIGEEIGYMPRSSRRLRFASIPLLSSTAASVAILLVLMIGLSGLFGGSSVEAYVSIDMNPSVELGIDAKERVRELKGLNQEGSHLIEGLSFVGRPLSEVTEELLMRAESGGYREGEADIVVAITLVNSTTDLDDWLLSTNVKDVITSHIQKTAPAQSETYHVTAFAVPEEVRQAAQAEGLSTGKYSVYLSAKGSGMPIDLQQMKEQSIHSLLEKSGGAGSLIAPDKQTKEAIKDLLKAEKNGQLGKPSAGKPASGQSAGSGGKGNGESSSRPALSPAKDNQQTGYGQKDRDEDDDEKDKKNKKEEKKNDKKDDKKDSKAKDENAGNASKGGGHKEDDDDQDEDEGRQAYGDRFGISSASYFLTRPPGVGMAIQQAENWREAEKKREAARKADEERQKKEQKEKEEREKAEKKADKDSKGNGSSAIKPPAGNPQSGKPSTGSGDKQNEAKYQEKDKAKPGQDKSGKGREDD